MMEEIGQETPTLQNAAIVVLIFMAVYGMFYAWSVNRYVKIVWKRAGATGSTLVRGCLRQRPLQAAEGEDGA